MLLVSTGVSVSVHYCNGNIIDLAVNKRAKACEGALNLHTDTPYACSFSRKSCCSDQDWLLVVENEVPPVQVLHVPVSGVLVPVTVLPIVGQRVNGRWTIDGVANAPPGRSDVQALFQVFLI